MSRELEPIVVKTTIEYASRQEKSWSGKEFESFAEFVDAIKIASEKK